MKRQKSVLPCVFKNKVSREKERDGIKKQSIKSQWSGKSQKRKIYLFFFYFIIKCKKFLSPSAITLIDETTCVCHTFIWRSFLPLFKVTLSISGNALSAISFPLCGAYGSSHFALFSNTNVAVVILTLEFFCLMWDVYIFTQKTPPSRCYCCHCIFGWRKIEWDSIIRRRAHYYAPP